MINNRQNGRRRGRGGVRPPNGANGGNDRGSRIDNRSRGNAAQLHEKYKALARDAQMQGDRVLTEYYLQFADHYFRMLSENRPRLDEQQQRRNDGFDEFEDGDDDGGQDEMGDMRQREQAPRYAQQQDQRRDRGERPNGERQGGERQGNDRPAGDRQGGERQFSDRPAYNDRQGQAERQGQNDRQSQNERPGEGGDGYARENGGNGAVREPRRAPAPEPRVEARPEPAPVEQAQPDGEEQRPRRGRRPRADQPRPEQQRAEAREDAPRIEIDRLPPALAPAAGPAPTAGEAEEPAAPAPRRRGRPRRVPVDDAGSAAEV